MLKFFNGFRGFGMLASRHGNLSRNGPGFAILRFLKVSRKTSKIAV
jgi:hypothetical protein